MRDVRVCIREKMVQICYIYILGYRGVENLGISLDARYTYNVDTENREITVSENPNYVEGFWPEGITSLAAIVGNNGAGKTTSLLQIIEAFEEGYDGGADGVIVIYRENDIMYAYLSYGYSVIPNTSDEWKPAEKCPKVNMFYYSANFRPYQNPIDPGEGEFRGVYNASDAWLLIRDYHDYSNVNLEIESIIDESMGAHLASFITQDNNRIVHLISDRELRKYLPKNAIPHFIQIRPNQSGYRRVVSECHQLNQKLEPNQKLSIYYPSYDSTIDGKLADFVAGCIFNIGVEKSMTIEGIQCAVNQWDELYKEKQDVRAALTDLYGKIQGIPEYLREVQEAVSFLYDLWSEEGLLCIDALKTKNSEKIKMLKRFYNSKVFPTTHIFDMSYSHSPQTTSRLSSGEYDMLKLFSRLFDATCVHPRKYDGKEYIPQLILIDEAENSYHPEWQRKFVNVLMQFLSALYFRKNSDEAFQVVLTTHSPILLSDIPRDCVNYIEKNAKTGKIKLSKNQPETFGANVFELYRNAFFMKEGLIGEYAKKKILEIKQDIHDGRKSNEELMREIELIGDKAIKAYLVSLLEMVKSQDMLTYYRRKVEELESRIEINK